MKLLILIFLKRFQKLILISLHVIYIILSPWIEIKPLSLTSKPPYKCLRNYILPPPPYPALWFKFRPPLLILEPPFQIIIAQSLTLQKRAVRTISRSAFDARTDPIFKGLKLLKFENIVSLQVAKILYLYKSGQLPESFKNMFFTGKEIHNYNTRNRSFFRLPSCRTNVRKFSLRFQGPKIFNSINDEIKNSLSLREFTSKLKSTFLD